MQFTVQLFRRVFGRSVVGLVLSCAPAVAVHAQSTTTPNPQDVPKQTPGTNNPDVSKDHRSTPGKPAPGAGQPHEADVPEQQPGTNNPDVAKDHKTQEPSSGDTTTSGKKQRDRKKSDRKTTTSS